MNNQSSCHSPPRVFILEDSPIISLDLASAAEDLGCEIVGPMYALSPAVSDLAKHGDIDVAIIDLVLSNGHSDSIIQSFQERGVPVVVCSGLMVRAVQSEYPKATVLGKPHSNDALKQILTDLITERAGRGRVCGDCEQLGTCCSPKVCLDARRRIQPRRKQ